MGKDEGDSTGTQGICSRMTASCPPTAGTDPSLSSASFTPMQTHQTVRGLLLQGAVKHMSIS